MDMYSFIEHRYSIDNIFTFKNINMPIRTNTYPSIHPPPLKENEMNILLMKDLF
jgi:hypothetical protein